MRLSPPLSAAGLPSDRFCYEGFLPAKSKGRRDTLKALEEEPRTLIFYESTHRLVESLEDICAVLGESRYVVLARELTKTWESIHGAPIGELVAWVKEDENRRKGEMVLIVEGFKAQEEALPAARAAYSGAAAGGAAAEESRRASRGNPRREEKCVV